MPCADLPLLLLVPALAFAGEAVMTRVVDGDTIGAGGREPGGTCTGRRCLGIGPTSSHQGLILNRRVRLEIRGTDRYDRLIAEVDRERRNVNRCAVTLGRGERPSFQGRAGDGRRRLQDHRL